MSPTLCDTHRNRQSDAKEGRKKTQKKKKRKQQRTKKKNTPTPNNTRQTQKNPQKNSQTAAPTKHSRRTKKKHQKLHKTPLKHQKKPKPKKTHKKKKKGTPRHTTDPHKNTPAPHPKTREKNKKKTPPKQKKNPTKAPSGRNVGLGRAVSIQNSDGLRDTFCPALTRKEGGGIEKPERGGPCPDLARDIERKTTTGKRIDLVRLLQDLLAGEGKRENGRGRKKRTGKGHRKGHTYGVLDRTDMGLTRFPSLAWPSRGNEGRRWGAVWGGKISRKGLKRKSCSVGRTPSTKNHRHKGRLAGKHSESRGSR